MALLAFTWAGRVAADAAAALGALRLIHGLEADTVAGEIWVRGPKLRSQDEETARRVPWEERYEILEGNQLRRAGRILPEAKLPDCRWTPLAQFLRARLPVRLGAGYQPMGVAIELRPVETTREPNLLEAATSDWVSYVETAGELRLQRLAYAVNERIPERVFITGVPLPPLPGVRYVEADGIATPAGYQWYPSVAAESVRTALGIGERELVILQMDNSWSRVPRSAWIMAARSSVRLMFSPERYV